MRTESIVQRKPPVSLEDLSRLLGVDSAALRDLGALLIEAAGSRDPRVRRVARLVIRRRLSAIANALPLAG